MALQEDNRELDQGVARDSIAILDPSGGHDTARAHGRAISDHSVSSKSQGSVGCSKPVASHELSRRQKQAFERLPEEIIQQVLYASDPNAFASLVLLNREWRRVSRNHKLYAFQLARCPSYAIRGLSTDESLTSNDLPKLQRLFYLEVKRNLFDTFLRPAQTLVKLVSTSVSSSSAFPGGEAFHFAFSSNGHFVLALSSSRIYLVSTTSSDVKVTREFKVLRRPVAAAILDDASILAVLSTDHQVNIYNLTGTRAKHVRSVPLDNPPRTIALSPGGSVLAAAYDGGIEVYSLAPNALSTDRRAVKCDAVDSLSFSEDGTLLLGTTLHSPNPNTVILSAPYYHEGGEDIQASELLSQMWTTSILFPNNSRDCSHATLLPRSSDGETSWAFTHDRVFETFRAVRVDDLRNGTTYFTGPLSTQFMDGVAIPTTLPSSNDKSEIVASGFAGREIYLYGVPENLDLTPESGQGSGSQGDGNMATSSFSNFGANSSSASTGTPSSPTRGDLGVIRLPQWQVLCDKFRNVFTKGRLMSTIDGLTAVQWVSHHERKHEFNASERLVAVAPGLIHNSDSPCDDEEVVPLDGGRIIVYDFGVGIRNGNKREIVIELGEVAPELLEEETRDLETEVALVRRRTVAQKRGGLGGPGHSGMARASTVRPGDSPARNYLTAPGVPPMPRQNVLVPPTSTHQRPTAPLVADGDPSYEEIREALDGPYTHNNPRSGTSLQRAATTAAANRRNMPPLPSSGRVEYRRGRRDPPHESDADNWVPPPPPYTESADQPLPDHLIMSLLPRRTEPLQRTAREPLSTPVRAQTSLEGMTYNALQRTRTTIERAGNSFRERRLSLRRALNDESQSSRGNEDALPPVPRLPVPQSLPRSVDHPVSPSFQVSAEDLGDAEDDLYRITPPQTPRAASSTNMRQETGIQRTSILTSSAVSSTLTVNSQEIRSSNEVDRQANHDILDTMDATPLDTTDTVDTADIAGRSERDYGSDSIRARDLEREVSISPSSPSASLVEGRKLESTPSRDKDNDSTAASSSQPDLQPSAENHPSHVSEYRIPRRPVNSSLLSRGSQALSLQTSQLPQEAHVSPTSSTFRSGVNRATSPSPPSSSGSQNLPSLPSLNHERSSSSSGLQPGLGNESVTPVPPSPEQISALQRRYSGSNDLNRPRPTIARPSSGYGVYNPEGGYTRTTVLGLAQGVHARSPPTGLPHAPPVGSPQTNQGFQSRRHSGYGPVEQVSQRGGPPNDSLRNALHPRNTSPATRSPGSRSSANLSPGTRSPSARSPAASTPNLTLRPDLLRLDTIHSVASQHSHLIGRGRGSIYLPGAASKSTEDLKANKRRGWGKLKRGKDEERKSASKEESWEDVKRAWIKAEKEKKSSKCVLM